MLLITPPFEPYDEFEIIPIFATHREPSANRNNEYPLKYPNANIYVFYFLRFYEFWNAVFAIPFLNFCRGKGFIPETFSAKTFFIARYQSLPDSGRSPSHLRESRHSLLLI